MLRTPEEDDQREALWTAATSVAAFVACCGTGARLQRFALVSRRSTAIAQVIGHRVSPAVDGPIQWRAGIDFVLQVQTSASTDQHLHDVGVIRPYGLMEWR